MTEKNAKESGANGQGIDLERIIAEVVREMLAQEAPAPPAGRRALREDRPPQRGSTAWRDRQAAPEVAQELHRSEPVPEHSTLPGVRRLANADGLQALVEATPARLGIGRAGLRYPTDIYLTLRGDHAVAKDAVVSTPQPGFVQSLGAIELRSQAADLETFLLQPDHGRVLDDASLQTLRAQGTKGADVQIIFADGLSAWAAERNAALLPALQKAIGALGLSIGRPIWVHRARIAVADQIGVELAAKATLICLGERPGLGTGDSLSIYLAWNPKLDQDNSEKNCISNVRPAGFSVDEAARQAADILKRSRDLGQGGLALGRPGS